MQQKPEKAERISTPRHKADHLEDMPELAQSLLWGIRQLVYAYASESSSEMREETLESVVRLAIQIPAYASDGTRLEKVNKQFDTAVKPLVGNERIGSDRLTAVHTELTQAILKYERKEPIVKTATGAIDTVKFAAAVGSRLIGIPPRSK